MAAIITMIAVYALQAFYYTTWIYLFMSWIPNLRESRFGFFIGKIVEPYLSIFRRFIPPIGGLDFSPIVALFVFRFLENLAISGLSTFFSMMHMQ